MSASLIVSAGEGRSRGGRPRALSVSAVPGPTCQVVDKDGADDGAKAKDPVVVGVRLARGLKALRVKVDDAGAAVRGPLRLAPEPDAPRLRVPRVADSKAILARQLEQLVQQKALPAPIGPNDDDGRHGPGECLQGPEALLIHVQLGARVIRPEDLKPIRGNGMGIP